MGSIKGTNPSSNSFAKLLDRYLTLCRGYEAQQSESLGLDAVKVRLGLTLYRNGPLSISELSEALGVSHPAVLKIALEFIGKDWVADYRDRRDKRRRLLALTNEGSTYFMGISAHDAVRRQAFEALAKAVGVDQALTDLDQALQDQSLESRVQEVHDQIKVLPYNDANQAAFERLNRAWIEQYFRIEAEDSRIFADPRSTIIEPGGEIFMAVVPSGEVVGTCAMILSASKPVGELAKMAVHPHFQGFGIGRRLGQSAIAWAESKHLEKITLESNQRLRPALALYESLGFEQIELPPGSEFARADIAMVLMLREV